MKILLSICLLSLLSLCAIAQGTITGKVQTSNSSLTNPFSVSLFKAADSSLVKTTFTEAGGSFLFEHITAGNYVISVTGVGYSAAWSKEIVVANKKESNIGILTPAVAAKQLAEVIVQSKRPFIERKLDKTIVNADALVSSAGNTALELLEKAPGVTVDKDGNISLKGKQGVVIMIDGKPTYMSGVELTSYLSNLPATAMDQIEVMTNPSAKYDAAGNTGIINFRTKKIKQKGFNGSINSSVSVAQKVRTSNSINLNYRKNKVNLFAGINANAYNGYQYLDIDRTYFDEAKNVTAYFSQNSKDHRIRKYLDTKIGLDYFASPKTTVGMVLSGYLNPMQENGTNTSYLKNANSILDSSVLNTTYRNRLWKNGALNVNLRHKIDSTGREITADVDYLGYNGRSDQSLLNQAFTPGGNYLTTFLITGNLPSCINIFSVKTDYTQPIDKKIKFETGLKSSYVTTDNRADYFLTENTITAKDEVRTNYFEYRENINAGYINFSTEKKKWGLQTGLRLEHTSYTGLQYGNKLQHDSAFKNSYLSAFPTAFVSYQANNKNQFGLALGRRINRPDYDNLNPFYHFIDVYTYDKGNPFLRPMFSYNAELSHTYNNKFTTTLNYTLTKNLFGEMFQRNGNAIVVTDVNFGKSQNLSLDVNAPVTISKWWKLNLYAAAIYSHLQTQNADEPIDIQITSGIANLNNQFKFGKGWSAELSGNYRSKVAQTQVEIIGQYRLNAGVQKQILKKKGNLRFAINDFTGPTENFGRLTSVNATAASFTQHSDSRAFTLGFNYKFGKPLKTEKRKTGGAADEQNRVGGAG